MMRFKFAVLLVGAMIIGVLATTILLDRQGFMSHRSDGATPFVVLGNGEIEVQSLKAFPRTAPVRNVGVENFSARVRPAGRGIEIIDSDASTHAYVSWKPGMSAAEQTMTVRLEIAKSSEGGHASLVAIRFFRDGKTFDHEFLFDAFTGAIRTIGLATPKDISVAAEGSVWQVTCRAKAPAGGESDTRLNFGPSVGATVGSLDPKSTGGAVVHSISIE